MIYFVQAENGGPIKIGYTGKATPDDRVSNLQTGNPKRLLVLYSYQGCEGSEVALHERFARARMSGEWFYPVPELLDHIDRMRGTKAPHVESLLAAFLRRYELEGQCDGTIPSMQNLADHVLREAWS